MRLRIAVLLVPLLACSGDLTAPGIQGLEEQRMRWSMLGFRDYDFVMAHGNEWFPTRAYRMQVRNRVVWRVLDAGGHSIAPDAYPLTIDSLFVRAKWALDTPENVVDLRFDVTRHYPTRLHWDAPQWADDAGWYFVYELTPR